jgi:hypothetical protein
MKHTQHTACQARRAYARAASVKPGGERIKGPFPSFATHAGVMALPFDLLCPPICSITLPFIGGKSSKP